jgi:hypothetical protein
MKILLFVASFCVLFATFEAQREQTVSLDVIRAKQDTDYYSGPATAEAVLRFFGLTPQTIGVVDSNQQYQMFLANFMWTDVFRGTSSFSFWKIMNYFIRQYGLNEERLYSFREVPAGYSNSQEFHEIVLRSLLMNVPVVVTFKGIAPHAMQTSEDHFIVITGVAGPANNAIYMYIEPGDGTYRVFGNDYLPILFSGSSKAGATNLQPSHIFAHLSATDLIYINAINSQTKIPGSTHCNFLTVTPFVYQAYGSDGVLNIPPLGQTSQSLRRFRRSETVKEIPVCSTVDMSNPRSNPNDQFHVWFRLFTNNGIEIRLTRETAISLMRIYIEHDKKDFLRYATALMAKIEQLGNHYDTDHEHGAKILYEGMTHIHLAVQSMQPEEQTIGRSFVFVRTYRSHDFEKTVKKLGLENTVYVSEVSRA